MADSSNDGRVHVVEDNKRIADMYRKWLASEYDATVSYNGEDALDVIDEEVDLVLLDRDLPNKDGDEVLAELRDRGLDVVVTMLTATDPGTGLADMDCDDYLRKPVPEETLMAKAEELMGRLQYDEDVREFLALARRAELLEEKYSERRLEDDDQYNALLHHLNALEPDVDLTQLDRVERPDVDL